MAQGDSSKDLAENNVEFRLTHRVKLDEFFVTLWLNVDTMKLVLTLLVRDEEDIIKSHLDYHLSLGIDHIVITDNLSVDGTVDVLRHYAQHPKITVWKEAEDNYAQAVWVTKMAQHAQNELKADWVIHSDCDEFLIPWKNMSIKDILGGYSSAIEVINIYRHDFVPLTNEPSDPLREMIFRKKFSTNILGNALPPKIIHRNIPLVQIGQGNHNLTFPTNLTYLDCNEIEMYHFPIRSFKQFENKIRKGGRAYEANTELDPTVGSTWRFLYEQYKKGLLADEYNNLTYTQNEISEGLSSGELVLAESLKRKISL